MAAFPRLCFAVTRGVSKTLEPRKKDVHFAWSGRSTFLISPYNPNIARKCASATLRVRLRTMITFGPNLGPSRSLGTGERDTERISSSSWRLFPSLRGDSERPRDISDCRLLKFVLLCPVICSNRTSDGRSHSAAHPDHTRSRWRNQGHKDTCSPRRSDPRSEPGCPATDHRSSQFVKFAKRTWV